MQDDNMWRFWMIQQRFLTMCLMADLQFVVIPGKNLRFHGMGPNWTLYS